MGGKVASVRRLNAYYVSILPESNSPMMDTAPDRKAESLAKSDPVRNCL